MLKDEVNIKRGIIAISSSSKQFNIKVNYEWIIDRLNERSRDIDQYELEKVINILRKLEKEDVDS